MKPDNSEGRNRSWASQSTDVPNGRNGNSSFDTSPYSGPSSYSGPRARGIINHSAGGSSTMTITRPANQEETQQPKSEGSKMDQIPSSGLYQNVQEYHTVNQPSYPSYFKQEVSSNRQSAASSSYQQYSQHSHHTSYETDYQNFNLPPEHANRQIIGNQFIEREIRVPRKIVVEEQIERMVVIPETVRREQTIEETIKVKQRIVEIAKPVKRERYVEVPEFEYVEKRVEYPERIIQEKIVEIPRVEIKENITYVPKIVHSEKIVEVPVYEYREVPVERVVEVPEVREEVMIKEITVPRYVDVPVAEYKDVEVIEEITRNVPLPVETVVTENYEVPQIKAEYERVPVPIYAPRFVEVPVPVEQLNEEGAAAAAELVEHITAVCTHPYPSLCEIENVAEKARNFSPEIESDPKAMEYGWNKVLSSSNPTTQPRKNG